MARVLLDGAAMAVIRAGGVLVLVSAVGCTVGGGSSSTLSGGASGSGADAGDEAPSSEDAASAATDGTGASGEGGDPSSAGSDDDGDASSDDAASSGGGAGSSDGGDTTASSAEESSSSGGDDDLADGILDVTIISHDDCTFTTMPASISVPEGTEFTVNWISSGASEVEFDVAKIDQFNAVPIILGMEPGTSYHDEVRVWCGELFTGTFDFSVTSCFDPQYIPVDCSA